MTIMADLCKNVQFLELALADADTAPRLVTTPTAGEIALFLSPSNSSSNPAAQYAVVIDICIVCSVDCNLGQWLKFSWLYGGEIEIKIHT